MWLAILPLCCLNSDRCIESVSCIALSSGSKPFEKFVLCTILLNNRSMWLLLLESMLNVFLFLPFGFLRSARPFCIGCIPFPFDFDCTFFGISVGLPRLFVFSESLKIGVAIRVICLGFISEYRWAYSKILTEMVYDMRSVRKWIALLLLLFLLEI